ncbi:MAG: TrkA C-terminal domain-containing protein [Chloroflexota bacterium]|nr:TrkA C-terminal domain-containing protein [Chloroflexota bacterium]
MWHAFRAVNVLVDQADAIDVLDVSLHNTAVSDQPLWRIQLPGNALVLGIRRQGDVVVPHGDTVVQRADVLMLIGTADALREARAWLQDVTAAPSVLRREAMQGA